MFREQAQVYSVFLDNVLVDRGSLVVFGGQKGVEIPKDNTTRTQDLSTLF